MNIVVVSGNICTMPHFWLSRRGKPMLSFILAVHREPGRPQKAERADFLPVILAGRAAEELRNRLQVRTRLAIKGFLQSRNFTRTHADGTQTRHTTLEILCERVELLVPTEEAEGQTEMQSEPGIPEGGDEDWAEWDTNVGPVRSVWGERHDRHPQTSADGRGITDLVHCGNYSGVG